MAGEDAPTLRQQAKTYRRAITQGIETDEHYTAVAMDLLATASSLAVADLQDSTVKAQSRPAPPKPEPTRVVREPVRPKPQPVLKAKQATTSPRPQTVDKTERITPSKPKPQAQRKPTAIVQTPPSPPAQEAPKPVQKPPSPPAPPASLTVEPEPPIDMNEPFVTITIGPIDSGAQASSITTDLTVAGYVARMRREGARYFITLGPYRQTAAERIASRIRARFGQGAPVSLNPSTN
jgi:outer membrane biosynthesis protein TonB